MGGLGKASYSDYQLCVCVINIVLYYAMLFESIAHDFYVGESESMDIYCFHFQIHSNCTLPFTAVVHFFTDLFEVCAENLGSASRCGALV